MKHYINIHPLPKKKIKNHVKYLNFDDKILQINLELKA